MRRQLQTHDCTRLVCSRIRQSWSQAHSNNDSWNVCKMTNTKKNLPVQFIEHIVVSSVASSSGYLQGHHFIYLFFLYTVGQACFSKKDRHCNDRSDWLEAFHWTSFPLAKRCKQFHNSVKSKHRVAVSNKSCTNDDGTLCGQDPVTPHVFEDESAK